MKIDAEFKALIDQLEPEEREGLESSIAAEGVRDPLVVWTEEDVLLDGHNRYEIASRLKKPFNTVGLSFQDRTSAKVWIIRNQFNRRNLSAYKRAKLALKLDALLKPRAAERMIAGTKTDPLQKSDKGRLHVNVEIAKAAGLSHDTIHKARVIEQTAPEDVKAALSKGESSINAEYTKIRREQKESKREERRTKNAALVETTPDPVQNGARFASIVIDPPWDWGDEGDADQLGRARPTYKTMPIQELESLPVQELADDDCHLYMWITNRSLPKGFRLIESWGFRYVTCLTWCKPSFGMGNYFRGQSEHVLFAVKGSQMLKRKDVGTIFTASRGPGGHSSKPDEFYTLVESCSPGPYLEMFARRNKDGWTAWGAET